MLTGKLPIFTRNLSVEFVELNHNLFSGTLPDDLPFQLYRLAAGEGNLSWNRGL